MILDRTFVARSPHHLLGIGCCARTSDGEIEVWRESLAMSQELGLTWNIANVVRDVAILAVAGGQPDRAARLFAGALRIRGAIGLPTVWTFHQDLYAERIEQIRSQLGEAAFNAAWTKGEWTSIAETIAEANCVLTGDTPVPATQQRLSVTVLNAFELTARERDVLRLLAAGRPNQQIGDALCISPRTAQAHVTHLLAKLGLTNRTEAAAFAHRHGFA
jgi:DNA-binding CsgD family transcriptional regulator